MTNLRKANREQHKIDGPPENKLNVPLKVLRDVQLIEEFRCQNRLGSFWVSQFRCRALEETDSLGCLYIYADGAYYNFVWGQAGGDYRRPHSVSTVV